MSDRVTALIGNMQPGTLASALVDRAIRSGATRFPDFNLVRMQAREAMERRAQHDALGNMLSKHPADLAREIQSGFDALFAQDHDHDLLVRSVFLACGHAISYGRSHLPPVEAAELCMSVALFASWLDRRQSAR